MKIRIGIDYCTPAAERRIITLKDLENDIVIKEYNDKKDLVVLLLDCTYMEEWDLDYLNKLNENRLDDLIKEGIDDLSDLGDGSPNIIFIQYDDKIIYDGYNLDIDYKKATKEDIIDVLGEEVRDMAERIEEVNRLIKEIESKF